MITEREMSQLFHAITSMQALNVSGIYYIPQESVLALISAYTVDMPKIAMEKIDGGLLQWTLKWPIPLTDVVEDNPKEGEEGTPV